MSFTDFIGHANNFAWGPIILTLLVGSGIYLSFRVSFIQLTKFKTVMKHTLGRIFTKTSTKEGEVTPFQALTTALAATVGTGNIAGVTGAIAVGGPGAVFWMWFSAFFGMITKYAEVFLAIKYREKNEKGDWVGGPMYYIKNGLGEKFNWLAILFCLLGGLAAFGIGNMTQVNTIAGSINTTLNAFHVDINAISFTFMDQKVLLSSLICGVIVAMLIALVLFGGIKRIGQVAEMMVPFMSVLYIVCALIVLFFNLQYIDDILLMIFKGAFSAKAALGGAFGITIMSTIKNGIARGVFSNEAGLGSAPMAHASSSETNPVKQGLYGIFEVFMDTIVICTLTSVILLCGTFNGVSITWGQSAGAELISASFSTVFGSQIGSIIMMICITLFAFSTILSWALYGSRCCEFILGTKSIKIYQILFILIIVVGACLQLDLVWTIADTLNGFMIIPNLIGVLLLSPTVIKTTKDYFSKEEK